MFGQRRRINKSAAIMAVPSVFLLLVSIFGFSAPVKATFTANTQISDGQAFLQGEFAEVGVRANGAFGSTSVPSGFHANPPNCLGFRVDREMDGWGATTDDGDYFCPGSPFEGWQMKVAGSIGKNDHGQTGIAGGVSDIQDSGSSQCVSWNSASPYNGVSVSQRYCVPTAGQALHTDVTLTNTTGSAISDVYFGRGFDPDNATGSGSMTCSGGTVSTSMFQSCNGVTGQGTEAQATARWGNNAFIALQSFDARARVARQTGGFSSPDPADIWNAGNTLATSGTYLGNVGEMYADAGIYVALNVPTLGAGASTSFRISYVLSADGNNAPVLGSLVVSGIGQTSATVASTVNPKGFSTTAELVYSTDPDFGTSSSVSMGTLTGTDEVAIDAEITGLDPSEIYYAKIVATNETGETESAVFEFETLAATAPIVSSEEPTVTVDDGPVTLSGTLNPNGFSSTAVFQYSTTADFSGTVVDIPVSGTFTGTSLSTVSTVVEGLTGSTTYYFRLKVTNASGSAYGSTLSFVPADIPASTSLEVTSLLDDGSSGTLRWAINQANANAGGIYDAIDITTEGTITLTSDLPAITAGVTITGTGMATTIIDGNNLYRAIYNNGSRTIVIEDMTFKQGKNVSWNGGLIYNASGTMTFNRIKISNHSSWAFYQGGGGVTTFNDSQFTNNGYAITSDHGGTPTALSLTDTDYSNRIYVNDSTFTSNTYGIRTERFVKINNSQFTGNTQFGAYLGGLNRQQVLNSTFTSNGVGVYFSSWIPTSWAVGAGNQTVSGNTFNGNTTAIQFANNWNNGSSVYNGVSANSFSTASENTFGVTAQNTNNFSGSGYVESDNTITAAYLNPVTNLTAVANADGSVDLDWDASAASNTSIYGYSVSFYDLTVIGGATSGGWGVWTNQGTNYSLSTEMFSGSNPVTTGYGPVRFGIKAMTAGCAGVGTGSCTYGPEVTVDATVLDPTPTSSTTTTTTSTTVAPVVVTPPDGTTVPLPQYPEPETESTTVSLPVETGTGIELPTETIPEYSEPIGIDPTETETVVVIIPPDDYTVTDIEDNEPITTVILDNILENTFTTDIEADEVGAVLDTLLGAELTNTQFDNVLEAVFTEDVSADVFTEALTTILDADITSAQLTAVLDSAFSEDTSAENMVSALVSIFDGPLSSGDLNTVMAAVFDEDISVADTMTVLGDLLETNLSASETDAIFDSVFDDDLSDAETIDLIVDVLEDGLTAENLGAALGAVFDEEVSTEVLIETFTAVLGNELDAESVGVIVDVLESDTITSEQVGQVVTLVIEQEGGVESGQATELATSAKVLESIDGEQASAVFNAIVVSEVSEEAGAAISEALTEAPTDVKESFEEEINVFAGVFDTYEPLGSTINVGQRRSVIAVNLVTSTVALAAAAGAIPTPGSSPSSPSSPSGPRQDVAVRREDEEAEEGGAIEGEGPEWIKRISIYKYEDGVRVMDWKNFARKFVYGIMASGFTLAGATVMYFTLSGLTQQIALWGTVLAFTGSMYLHMKEPDSE